MCAVYTAATVKKPALWIGLALLSVGAALVAFWAFPGAFSIIALDISMDRDHALASARTIAARDHIGPADFREAASFTLDDETQTFVELEGGGKEAFTAMVRDGLYAAYTWRVRHFKEGEVNEATVSFTPDGRPNGFVERIKEDAPGAALEAAAARQLAEREATANWSVDFTHYALVEQGQERRTSGRVDHTLTYERPSPTLRDGRYRLKLVVSGDRLTAVSPFVKVPEAFLRRYESLRSANTAIGAGSVVAMLVLYGVGGIGIGLFYMLRRRWVLWSTAIWWGAVVAGLQMLAAVNEWPLMWMGYDTAVSRTTFFSQQIAGLVAGFFGFTALYALSFMTAETLTRRAFGDHPQLWRVWSKGPGPSGAAGPGSSTAVLGRTAAGYLFVSVFFAYDVVLYLVATRKFGWWAPSEALLHPDVLATYVPWFSAIANSLQAGFWEECLFRAVPIAGAALIGDRFGKRRLFIVIAFVVQAIIFGSGHAPYQNQPAYARPVELIIPSIGFGLLYLYFGLLPGIILHFVFDTVWFALAIFVSRANGIWLQQSMVVLVALVPLWIVLWRRMQAGAWTSLDQADRNRAWQPEAPVVHAPEPEAETVRTLRASAGKAWIAVGLAALVACAVLTIGRRSDSTGTLQTSKNDALTLAKQALDARGATLPAGARFMATADNGAASAHQFISETAGELRRKALIGSYVPRPRWAVRVATFDGDVAQRAEEWQIFVTDAREAWPIVHELPEARPGASLDEATARRRALDAIAARWHLDLARGDIREISAKPQKLAARTDWTFTFVDLTVPKLPQGEPRITVGIAGDEVVSAGRLMFIPEDWRRAQEAAGARNSIVQGIAALVPAGLLLSSAVLGMLAWSRGRYAPKLFFLAAAQNLLASGIGLANQWPALASQLSTAQPLQLQIGVLIGVSVVGLALAAALVGLAVGALPARIARIHGGLGDREAFRLGAAAGCTAAALFAAAAWLRTPVWSTASDLGPLDSVWPVLAMVADEVPGFLAKTAVLTTLLAVLGPQDGRWNWRRLTEALALFVVGFTLNGAPAGSSIGGWFAASCLTGLGLVVVSMWLLTVDLTMVPIAVGMSTAIGNLMHAASPPFPGAWIGSVAGAAMALLMAWWWFYALRKGSRSTPAVVIATG
jgi:hypothetical protein